MKPTFPLTVVLLGLVLLTGLAVAVSSHQWHEGPVYSVAAVRAQLAHDPRAWVGRTVVVRALAEPCPWWGEIASLQHCAGRQLVLAGAPAEAPSAPLQPVPMVPHPLLGLLPRPRMVPLLVPARFRVRLLALPADACAARLPCYEALLLDAAPDAT